MSTAAARHQVVQGACGVCCKLLLALIAVIPPTIALALLGAFSGIASAAEMACPASPAAPLGLPHLRAALDSGTEGLIVALGSSSTVGVMASDLGHSYPAELQSALSDALPRSHIAVINRGIGGQDAPEELARLDSDVIALRPALVVWQVGANGALRNADPAAFRRMVTEGVRRLQAAGADVILMDSQHSPRILASAEHAAMDESLAAAAQDTGANLFSRGELMDAWAQEGAPEAEFIAADGLHHNDRGYFCIAHALAADLVAGLHGALPVSASR